MEIPWRLLLVCIIFAPWFVMSDLAQGRLEEGRTQLQRMQEFARHPRFGDCWTGALKRVDVGCRQLDEDEQSRIALAFTHCHLQRSGRIFPDCTESSSVRDCTQSMDAVAFGTYTEFFTHAHSICYFLQNEVWQKQAEDTILRLTVNSDSVARQLEATNQMAEEMIQTQNATRQTQEEILKNGDLLKRALQDSTQDECFGDTQELCGTPPVTVNSSALASLKKTLAFQSA
ncbi:protein brambleberry-like [Ambystoma mexicanum]|uniref:protein brambleberry-like n=1 Tax=Ambystoma mexicanum TaxID=8296 RepID=UPI0037E99A90